MEAKIRRLTGANMDIDLATSPGQITWQQEKCPWNEAEGVEAHRCAVKNVALYPYFCGVEYLDVLLCCYRSPKYTHIYTLVDRCSVPASTKPAWKPGLLSSPQA